MPQIPATNNEKFQYLESNKKLWTCKEVGKHDLWSGIKIITISRNNPEMVRMMEWVDISHK